MGAPRARQGGLVSSVRPGRSVKAKKRDLSSFCVEMMEMIQKLEVVVHSSSRSAGPCPPPTLVPHLPQQQDTGFLGEWAVSWGNWGGGL